MSDLMIQATPPENRGRKQSAKVGVRREQLHQNPDTWFLWQDNAKNHSYSRKTALQLLGLKQGDKIKMKQIPYEFRSIKNENDSCYTLYVRYIPTKGQQ